MPTTQTEAWMPSEPDVMEVTGRLDDATASILEEDALLCIESGARRIVLDCQELAYISGAGLRAVLALARAMQSRGGRIALCGLQPQVEEMFGRSGCDDMVPIYGDRDQAFAAFAG